MAFRVGPKRRHVEYGHVRHVARQFRTLGTDQQLANEQRVPGELRIDARLDPVLRIGAAVEVLREQGLALRMRNEVLKEGFELRLGLFAVAVPPDGVLCQRIDNRVLVLGRATGVMAGLGAERAAVDQRGFLVGQRVLIERRLGQIPMNGCEVFQAEFVGAIGTVPHTSFLHQISPTQAGLFNSRSLDEPSGPHGYRRKYSPSSKNARP